MSLWYVLEVANQHTQAERVFFYVTQFALVNDLNFCNCLQFQLDTSAPYHLFSYNFFWNAESFKKDSFFWFPASRFLIHLPKNLVVCVNFFVVLSTAKCGVQSWEAALTTDCTHNKSKLLLGQVFNTSYSSNFIKLFGVDSEYQHSFRNTFQQNESRFSNKCSFK